MPSYNLSKMNFSLTNIPKGQAKQTTIPTNFLKKSNRLLTSSNFSLFNNIQIPKGQCGSCGKNK
tara:strand:+ start:158 stop:349 length:192 start_codon:yes stop_codon:yes gene_type:complete